MSSNNSNEPSESVIDAIMKNDVLQLKLLREAGVNFASLDDENNTLLHLTILSRSERKSCEYDSKLNKSHLTRAEAFNYLLTLNEINKEMRNSEGNTALMEIFLYLKDSPDWAIKLIKSGCDIYGRSRPLYWAVMNDWDEVAELLIENGCEIDESFYENPLCLACKLGYVDLVWMLLFYGADPNNGNCLDLIFTSSVKYEIREIFESLTHYEKVFNLRTFVDAMNESPELFYKLCDTSTSDHIDYPEDELDYLCSRLHMLNPELFKIFVRKYGYVIRDMFKYCWPISFYICGKQDKSDMEIFVTNIYTILESDVVESVIKYCNSLVGIFEAHILCFVHWFFEHNELDLATQVILSMLSYGVKVPAELMHHIYDTFGYCSLFKILLYMDIPRIDFDRMPFVPRIFYDVSLTPQDLIECFKDPDNNNSSSFHLIFDYFALPKLVKCCLDEQHEHVDQKTLDHLMFRCKRLPVVPMLVELARNEAREFIIHKYKIRKSRQFHTIIDWLPIPKIHKEILTYERTLYG